MSYRYLEHSTDAFIEVKAKNLEEAFSVAGKSVVETIIDLENIQEIEEKSVELFTQRKKMRKDKNAFDTYSSFEVKHLLEIIIYTRIFQISKLVGSVFL